MRESQRSENAYTLCMLFDGRVMNYKVGEERGQGRLLFQLYYDGTHYVGEKRFESIASLVADGLISMFMDKHASEYIKRMADDAIYEQRWAESRVGRPLPVRTRYTRRAPATWPPSARSRRGPTSSPRSLSRFLTTATSAGISCGASSSRASAATSAASRHTKSAPNGQSRYRPLLPSIFPK